MPTKVRRSRTSTKKVKGSAPPSDSDGRVETGNPTLDSLFNDDLIDPKKYNQEIVRIVKNHLATKDIASKAGTQLSEDLIRLAEARGTK